MDVLMEMSYEFRKRMADFISEYIDTINGGKYEDDDVIRQSIRILITENVFTVEELRKQALKDHYILIPKQFIRECVYG